MNNYELRAYANCRRSHHRRDATPREYRQVKSFISLKRRNFTTADAADNRRYRQPHAFFRFLWTRQLIVP